VRLTIAQLLFCFARPCASFMPIRAFPSALAVYPQKQLHAYGQMKYYTKFRINRMHCSPDTNMQKELGLDDRFDRWRWLQQLLDDETDPLDTNKILYQVLDLYLKTPAKAIEGSPELTPSRKSILEFVLQSSSSGMIPALSDDSEIEMESMYEQLERLLPDAEEDADAFKSLWDIVIELTGRESVKINERSGGMKWKMRCLVARILLHYDFLSRGIPII
jgi:hypothetical protein